ncbi:MAG: CbiX/SirB N-terminal domain-containing protein [Verrucomicrobiota bacterium]
MSQNHFHNDVLVLLGHGSTKNADSERPVFQHTAELRRRRLFREVREAFWIQEPQARAVVAGITAPRVFIVPLFVSEGYFSTDVIPKALGFAGNSKLRTQNSELFYCRVIGTHDLMTSVLLARARDVMAQFPFPRAPRPKDTTLFIAGHGTEQNDHSRRSIDRQVELIRATGEFAEVHPVFMDQDPRIGECYALAQTRNIVVVPFFISDGMHVQEDIPMLLGEPERVVRERLAAGQSTWRNPTERQEKLVWYSRSVGTEPLIAEVILERVREAGAEVA